MLFIVFVVEVVVGVGFDWLLFDIEYLLGDVFSVMS